MNKSFAYKKFIFVNKKFIYAIDLIGAGKYN